MAKVDAKQQSNSLTRNESHPQLVDLYEDEMAIDPVYQAKTRILNRAIQKIGMGKYQVSKQAAFR
jgi:hypothetical protein